MCSEAGSIGASRKRIEEHLFKCSWFCFCAKTIQSNKRQQLFQKGKALYEWTKEHLQDSTDYLYFDNIRLDGKIGKAKFAYNSGQMMQSAALLYQLTNNPVYLKEAQSIAKECYNYFFYDLHPYPENHSK